MITLGDRLCRIRLVTRDLSVESYLKDDVAVLEVISLVSLSFARVLRLADILGRLIPIYQCVGHICVSDYKSSVRSVSAEPTASHR